MIAQKDALEKQKKNANTANKSIKTKSILQKASAAGYVDAGALAAWQVFEEKSSESQCMGVATEASSELAACASSSAVSTTEGMGCAECGVKVKANLAEIELHVRARDKGTLLSSQVDLAQNETQRASILTKMSAPCTGGTAQVVILRDAHLKIAEIEKEDDLIYSKKEQTEQVYAVMSSDKFLGLKDSLWKK